MNPSRKAAFSFFLGLTGLGLTLYLGWLHIGLLRGELLGGAACGAGGGVFNCHAVTAGRLGSFASIPIWIWGAFAYLAVIYLALLAWNFPDIAAQATVFIGNIAVFSVIIDLILFTVMVTQVKHFCLFCLLTYLTNVLLVFSACWAAQLPLTGIVKSFGRAFSAFLPTNRQPYGKIFWLVLLISAGSVYAAHRASVYVAQGSPALLRKQIQEFVSQEQRQHLTVSEGDASEGSKSALITVVEFSDFFCPACQKASRFKPILLAGRSSEVRFVFKHFPLDTLCNDSINRMVHPGACAIAAASKCAQRQGKFWQFHDAIFKYGHDYDMKNLQADVRRLGLDTDAFNQCIASGEAMDEVRREAAEGKRLGVSSTPTFFVNGLKMPGIMTPAVFDSLLETLRQNP